MKDENKKKRCSDGKTLWTLSRTSVTKYLEGYEDEIVLYSAQGEYTKIHAASDAVDLKRRFRVKI